MQDLQAYFDIDITAQRCLACWGIITRTAFHLGLHRCPGRFACFSRDEADMRRRLFWSIYCLERYLSQALGIPLSIRDDDIDVCYPDDERHTTPNALPYDHRLGLLSHLARFSRIRGLILELRNKSILHSRASTVEAFKVNGELSQWWNEVYDAVNPIEDDDPRTGGNAAACLEPYHRLLLTILRHEAIISMNRPLLAAEKPNPEFKSALQTCISSSRCLLAAFKKYMSSSQDAPLTWPSFTWTTWMACLILMYASWEGELPVSTALKYSRMGISVLGNLALRGSSWPETCIEAIKGMESALLSNAPAVQQMNLPSTSTLGDTDSQRLPTQSQTISPRESRHPLAWAGNQVWSPTASPENRRNLLQNPPIPSFVSRNEGSGDDTARKGNTGSGDRIFVSQQDQVPDVDSYGAPLHGHTSEGLIFGNAAISNPNFYIGSAGQEYVPFSDPSLFMNDFGSIADGPWIIDGNLL
ncbi:transcriptional regulator family: Fungal Specific TF [Penicillium chermesinum]|nr:transcriptional regulator family: Fungal Specific TF [Penicillium chermesinum]